MKLKLTKWVGFSAGSTMFGNMGQGNYVAANSFNDIMPARYRPEVDASTIMWGAVGGGIGMRFKAFASLDALNEVPDSLLSLQDAAETVKFVCTKMDMVPLVMPSRHDDASRQYMLQPTAGMIKLDVPVTEVQTAAEVYASPIDKAESKDREALRSRDIVDRRPVPGNLGIEAASPLGSWPTLVQEIGGSIPAASKTKVAMEVGAKIRLTGLGAKTGLTGTLMQRFQDGKWKVALDSGAGSAVLHESNFEVTGLRSSSETDQKTKDERTVLRQKMIQEKRAQLLEKREAKLGQKPCLAAAAACGASMRRKYYIVGTWTSWEAEELAWCDASSSYRCSFAASSGQEAFQVLLDQHGNSCLHAGEEPEAAAQGGVKVQGPAPRWRCEGLDFTMKNLEAGSTYEVQLCLNPKGAASRVLWKRI